MNFFLRSVGSLLIALLLSSCASRVPQVQRGNFVLFAGQTYELKRDAIRFLNRGYVDSLLPGGRKVEDLRPYVDYDPYSSNPISVIPAGTVLTIQKILLTRKQDLVVLARVNHERIDISAIADGDNLNPRESAFPDKGPPAAE